jgi:NAD(P)-dependent dehydrogenase (short-subunit alcohol dehydrogenase family)
MTKTVLVTGGSRGIGAAICKGAAQEGYQVAVNYLHDSRAAQELVKAIRDAGGTAFAFQADVGVEAEVIRMTAAVEDALGPIYGLVNNAGITGRLGGFLDADPESIRQIFQTNVLGVMHCCRAALHAFRRSGTPGVIVNVSSVAAVTGSPGEYVHYAASKAAVEAFTLGLAREFAADNIRICAVAPGSTLTGIHAAAGEPERPARVAPKIPMQRLAAPEEIAAPVLWLLSPAASYFTGTTLRCAGGL